MIAVGRQLTQPVDRIGDVDIALKPDPIEIDRDMADRQVSSRESGGECGTRAIPADIGISDRRCSAALVRMAIRLLLGVLAPPRACRVVRGMRARGYSRASLAGCPRSVPSGAQPLAPARWRNMLRRASSSISALKVKRSLSWVARCAAGRASISSTSRFRCGSLSQESFERM